VSGSGLADVATSCMRVIVRAVQRGRIDFGGGDEFQLLRAGELGIGWVLSLKFKVKDLADAQDCRTIRCEAGLA
jgi:hypothetical protein